MLKIEKSTALAIILILSLVLAASCLSFATVYAADDDFTTISDGFEFSPTDEGQIIGVNIPDSVTGKIKLKIPDGVTSIGANAFDKMSDVVAVELPSSLKTIGNYAFAQTSISSVTVSAEVTLIGEHAFHGCTALTNVDFANRTEELKINIFAFANCAALKTVGIPDNTVVSPYAFDGCTSLLWVYVGDGCKFDSSADEDVVATTFFPTNTQLTIIFSSQSEYNGAIGRSANSFNSNHGNALTYIVNVNCYVGAATQPQTYQRLHGRGFNFVKDDESSAWSVDTAYSVLPAQHESYASTTWYFDKELTSVAGYDNVNQMLQGAANEIRLYSHETVLAPTFPAEPVSWAYDSKVSYDVNDKALVLQALGCEQQFSDDQLKAINFNVVFADEKGKVAEETPDTINANGVYSVTLTLDSAYGSWKQTINPSLTVSVNTDVFNIVMIVLLFLGTIGMIATVSTAIIRKKIQDRHKRKQLTQKEVLEKYKAIGGETTYIK